MKQAIQSRCRRDASSPSSGPDAWPWCRLRPSNYGRIGVEHDRILFGQLRTGLKIRPRDRASLKEPFSPNSCGCDANQVRLGGGLCLGVWWSAAVDPRWRVVRPHTSALRPGGRSRHRVPVARLGAAVSEARRRRPYLGRTGLCEQAAHAGRLRRGPLAVSQYHFSIGHLALLTTPAVTALRRSTAASTDDRSQSAFFPVGIS